MERFYEQGGLVNPFLFGPLLENESAPIFAPREISGGWERLRERLLPPGLNNAPVVTMVAKLRGELLIATTVNSRVADERGSRQGLRITFGARVSPGAFFYHSRTASRSLRLIADFLETLSAPDDVEHLADALVVFLRSNGQTLDSSLVERLDSLFAALQWEFWTDYKERPSLLQSLRFRARTQSFLKSPRWRPWRTLSESQAYWEYVDSRLSPVFPGANYKSPLHNFR